MHTLTSHLIKTFQSAALPLHQALASVEAESVQVPDFLQGQELFFYHPLRNQSADAAIQRYEYFHYDGERVLKETAMLDFQAANVNPAIGRAFEFLIRNAFMHPRLALNLLELFKTSGQALDTIVDLQDLIASTLGEQAVKTLSRALRIRRLFFASVLLREAENDISDGFEFLQARIMRDDFYDYLEFIDSVRTAYYLYSYYAASSVQPEKCPFDHQQLEGSTQILSQVLDVRTSGLQQAVYTLMDEFGLSQDTAKIHWAFIRNLYSGVMALDVFSYDTYPSFSPLERYTVYDPMNGATYLFDQTGKLINHIFDKPQADYNLKVLVPSHLRFQTFSLGGTAYILPSLGHCPHLVWGAVAIRENLVLSAENQQRLETFSKAWQGSFNEHKFHSY